MGITTRNLYICMYMYTCSIETETKLRIRFWLNLNDDCFAYQKSL